MALWRKKRRTEAPRAAADRPVGLGNPLSRRRGLAIASWHQCRATCAFQLQVGSIRHPGRVERKRSPSSSSQWGRYSARPRWPCRYLFFTYPGDMDVGAYDTPTTCVVWARSLLARPETETAFARGRKSRLNGCTMDALETGVGTTRAHTRGHTHTHTHPFSLSLFSPGACRADAGGQATRPRTMHAS